MNIAKNAIGLGASFKTKNDKKEFESKLSEYNSLSEEKQKQIQAIYDSDEFGELNEFNNNIRKKYLEQKGLVKVEDENDYNNFLQSEYQKIDIFQQRKFAEQENLRQEKAAKLIQEANKIQEEQNKYLDDNVEGGRAKYEEYQNEIKAQFKDNETLKFLQELEDDSKEKHQAFFASHGKDFANLKGFEAIHDAFIEKDVTRQQQLYKLAGMDDLPHKDLLVQHLKKTNDAVADFQKRAILLQARIQKANKDIDDVEALSRAEKQLWAETSEENKKLIRDNQMFTVALDQETNLKAMQDIKLDDIDSILSAGVNSLNAGGNVIKQFFKKTYDVEDAD
nr:MAG TPA: hypothetical protein [Bacteriophage sp.]